VPLVAIAALAGGVLASPWGGSPAGAAPKSTHAKAVDSTPRGVKTGSSALPFSVQKKVKRKASGGAGGDGGAVVPATGPTAVLLELDTAATSSVYRTGLSRGRASAKSAARAQLGRVRVLQGSVEAAVRRAAPTARVLYRTHAALAAVAVRADASSIAALRRISGVRAVHPIATKRAANAGAIPLLGTPAAWQAYGDLGQNVTVGVIDTGIDYTHADFGPPGTELPFDAQSRTVAVPGQFPTAKVIGGYDFAGDDYNADPNSSDPVYGYQPVPHPDPNPLDCKYSGPDSNVGHGTHVSGTLTGLGVKADGSTYTGPYDDTTPFGSLKIGPGVAPKAALYGLRVFGCAGSTDVVGAALEWSLDPNGDGDPSDRLDVINMSLGSDFGSPQDGDAILSNVVAQQGVVVVASAGNGGDLYDVGGSPGNATRVLTAAGSDDGFAVLDALRVNSPASIDGDYGAEVSVAYDYAANPDTTGVLAEIPGPYNPADLGANNKDGCDPLSPAQAAAVNGKIAWLEWTDNDAERRCGSVRRSGNVKAAGATGFVFADDAEVFSAGITGDPVIPGVLIVKSAADTIRPHLGESVSVTIGNSLRNLVRQNLPANADKVYPSTSRGTRGNGNLKPDVAAVGVQVFSVDVGTGSDGKTLSGTSMSSPQVAGAAALVRSRHPDWSSEEVKAAVMNTADKDIYTGDNRTGDKYAPNRVGAGRVDVPAALKNEVLAYVVNDPGAVSVSFGPVAVTAATSLSKTVRVVNKGVTAASYSVSYTPRTSVPGVSYKLALTPGDVPSDSVTVALSPRGSATFVVYMVVSNPAALTKTIDPTVEPAQAGATRQFVADASGLVVLDATDSDRPTLRVPVYSAPRPASSMTTPGEVRLPAGAIVSGDLPLVGRGVDQGDGTEQVTSIVTGFGLQGTSGRLPACTAALTEGCIAFPDERSTDLRYVGVTTDSPGVVANGGNAIADGFAYFAVSSHGTWRTPAGFTDFEVYVDRDRDGAPDEILYTTRLTDTDLFVTQLLDISDPDPANWFLREDSNGLNSWFVNGFDGSVDTDIFDSDSLVLPVPLSALGVTTTRHRINYGVITFSAYHDENVDAVGFSATGAPALTVDVLRPAITATDGASPDLAYADLPGLPLSIRKDVPAYRIDRTQGLLLIHHHNVDGKRAQVVKVRQPSAPRIALSRTSITVGQTVTATVTVPSSAGPIATGTVQVKRVPGVVLRSGSLVNGKLTVTLPKFPRGTFKIYAQYFGDGSYLGGYTAQVTLTVR
jgi:subtilisin family serine protease